MKHIFRITLVVLALVALAAAMPRAQSAGGQNPPSPPAAAVAAQKPADPPQELPADAKAFNAAAGEKNPAKRIELLEKFIADNPKANAALVSTAKIQITSSVMAALKDARTRYQATVDSDLEAAKKSADTSPMYATYNRLATSAFTAGVYSEETEDFARKALADMTERTYTDVQKKAYDRALANYEKAAAAFKEGAPAAAPAAPAAPPASAGPNYTYAMKDGVLQAAIAPPRPAPAPRPAAAPRAPTKPTMPTDDEIRTNYRSMRASMLATFGQILMKRNKTDEGLKTLKDAWALKPAASTMATLARALIEPAKKAGNDADQLEYLTVITLAGRPTADESKDFEAVYKKTHNGTLDGLEAMLDTRWKKDNVRFAVTPYTRPAGAKPTGRTVLAEVFPGAG